MIATSGFLTALECTKFVFGRGSAPDPAGGAYSAPKLPSWFNSGGKEGRMEKGRVGRGGIVLTPSIGIFCIRHCVPVELCWHWHG